MARHLLYSGCSLLPVALAFAGTTCSRNPSDKPDDIDYPLELFVDCIIKTLDAAGVDTCSLVGNSLGGAIAIKMALDYP